MNKKKSKVLISKTKRNKNKITVFSNKEKLGITSKKNKALMKTRVRAPPSAFEFRHAAV